ncbi:hypothetical protein K458DRAFT_382880 [Lentithecium fluviatile CBS 122367]|uniref:Uncharacterized protein n=1 Tax=Lentithecium fluviatile CBS 122367 TaxID=1168545 RepID=A0A6G1JMG9_9PLEO|nr:hypothetical protein K458DRAFT_382880 [Lentithecium fluviatile CBS 122367]
MPSKFQEILEPTEAPTYTHPHLNVSLEDILREGRERERSSSQSSKSSHSNSQTPGNESPKSPTSDSKSSSFRRRAFTLGSKKGRLLEVMKRISTNIVSSTTFPTYQVDGYSRIQLRC